MLGNVRRRVWGCRLALLALACSLYLGVPCAMDPGAAPLAGDCHGSALPSTPSSTDTPCCPVPACPALTAMAPAPAPLALAVALVVLPPRHLLPVRVLARAPPPRVRAAYPPPVFPPRPSVLLI